MYKVPNRQRLAVREAVRRFRAKNEGGSKTKTHEDGPGSTIMSQTTLIPRHHKQLKCERGGRVDIYLPYKYKARSYQEPFLDAMRSSRNPGGKLRACCVWHRRAGKDKTFLNFLIPRMFERVGAYYYYFPTASLGRDILWDGMDRDGFKFIDHFPAELITRTNSTEMMIEMKNGSIFKIRGTDKREPIGVNPVGVVFSEFSRQNPAGGWDLVRPILAENEGWAVFNFTPRGKNHAYRLHRMANSNPQWFCQTLRADQTGAISPEAIEDERASGMSEELIQQEFYCSFDAGVEGSYYGRSITKLWELAQIGSVPWEPSAPVYTAWDLGIGDCTAIWCFQLIKQEIHVIDYYESYGEGLGHYAEWLRSKPYNYAGHWLPHDAAKREFQADGTVKTIYTMVANLLQTVEPDTGVKTPKIGVIAPHRVEQGIEQVRGILQAKGKVWINKDNCERGIDCLENYHKEYKDKLEVFSETPAHDWSSHGADAFRYLAVAYRYHIRQNDQLVGYTGAIPANAYAEDDEPYNVLNYHLRNHKEKGI